jgi:hypothetical protein
MGMWMWAAQLGALRHLQNRRHGLDLFTELSYALGFDDRLDRMEGKVDGDVAEIIDLQAERQRVERAQAARLEGTTGAVAPQSEKFAKDDPDAVPPTTDDLH